MEKQKQRVVSRLSAESEYRAMANVTCELVWIIDLLIELGFASQCLMRLYYDNWAAIHIAENLVFHKCIKHF